MHNEVVKEIYNCDRMRRVLIFRRDLSSFYYQIEHYSQHPFEMCWIPTRQLYIGIYDSEEKAENEARANID